MRHRTILIAVGSNLPGEAGETPLALCEWAVARLCRLPGLQLVATAPWYRSAPVPRSSQPDYVNGAARFAGAAEPVALLAALHAVEAEAGRRRGLRNAARTLDLDLLAVDEVVLDGPLRLPHPRLHERAFVLLPLLDIAPDWRHPVLNRGVAEMLRGVDAGGCTPLGAPALAPSRPND